MAQSGQKQSTRGRRPAQRRRTHADEGGIIPVLARTVRAIESAAERGKVNAGGRLRFRVVAVLAREERTRIKADTTLSDSERTKELTRLDGIATIMAKTAARDSSLIQLLTDTAPLTASAQELRRSMLLDAGTELSPEDLIVTVDAPVSAPEAERQVTPVSVKQYQRSNPFLAPDFSAANAAPVVTGELANWELIDPLFRAFEAGAGGGAASMKLPDASSLTTPGALDLMPHQAQFVESAKKGHRTYLLADEPGLGKTAQGLLAAPSRGRTRSS